MNILGFTGTQQGMTFEQKCKIRDLIPAFEAAEAHHGDCIGSDADFHHICMVENGLHVAGHPGLDGFGQSPKRAYCEVNVSWPPAPYLERNRIIVDVCNVLLATPAGMTEERRSGTWSTIRYAISTSTNVIIVYPNGRLKLLMY